MTTLPPGSVIEDKPQLWLREGWRLARTPAGACANPSELASFPSEWHDAKVPGTVASAIHADIDLPGNYDVEDWWYRLTFTLSPALCHSIPAPEGTPGGRGTARHRLRF